MYINELGIRGDDTLNAHGIYNNKTGSIKTGNIKTGNSNAAKTTSFADAMQKVIDNWNTTKKTDGEASSEDVEEACCERCSLNSRLVNQMMLQNLYLQSGLSSMNFTGLSSMGTGALTASAYGNLLNLF